MGQISYSNKHLGTYHFNHFLASLITPMLSNALAMTETLFGPSPFIFRISSGL
jgi:hypothetical protein